MYAVDESKVDKSVENHIQIEIRFLNMDRYMNYVAGLHLNT